MDITIEPNLAMDQYFLLDEAVLEREVALAKLQPGDIVLEVGAGIGNLTAKIAARCRVLAIEKDARFAPLLNDLAKVEVVIGDALTLLPDMRNTNRFNNIIANIPYALSKKLLLELLKHQWRRAVLVVQQEFAAKLAGQNRLGVLVRNCADMELAGIVLADKFYPVAIDSAMLVFRQRRQLDEKFWSFLNALYRRRNRDAVRAVVHCPPALARKKVHQLTDEEVKELYEMNTVQ